MKNTIFGILIGLLAMVGVLLFVSTTYKEEPIKKEIEVAKIDSKKEIVYTARTEKRKIEAGTPTEEEVTSLIPAININTDAIKKINSEISTYYDSIIKDNDRNYKMDYKFYTNKDYVSLVITMTQTSTTGPDFDTVVYVYNINASTGTLVTNNELIISKNLTVKAVYAALLNEISKEIKESDPTDTKSNDITLDRIQMIANELQINLPMYLNEKGNLSVVVDTEIESIQNGRYNLKYDLGL